MTGVPAKQALPLTVPESPAITKPRGVSPVQEDFAVPAFKAQPVPNMEHAFKPTHVEAPIEVAPFERFDAYPNPNEVRLRLQLAEEQKLAQQRVFHAQPLPSLAPATLPIVESKEITVPEPFNLKSEKLHEEYVQVFAEKIEKMTGEEKAKAVFKAQPVMKSAEFVPKKSAKPLTQVMPLIIAEVPCS